MEIAKDGSRDQFRRNILIPQRQSWLTNLPGGSIAFLCYQKTGDSDSTSYYNLCTGLIDPAGNLTVAEIPDYEVNDGSHRFSRPYINIVYRNDALTIFNNMCKYYEKTGAGWSEKEYCNQPKGYPLDFIVRQSASGSTHILVVSQGDPKLIGSTLLSATLDLYYYTDASGNWETEHIGNFPINTELVGAVPSVSMQVDAADNLHIALQTYIADPSDQTDDNGDQLSWPYYEDRKLIYLSNSGGFWNEEVAITPPRVWQRHSEAGWLPRLALDGTGRIFIASSYVTRVYTGSEASSELQYTVRELDGSWHTNTVTDQSAGYSACDGTQFTGYVHDLLIDVAGRPIILFSDIAACHGPSVFLQGQIRYARLDKGVWNFLTIQQQAVTNTSVYPAVATVAATFDDSGKKLQILGYTNSLFRDDDYIWAFFRKAPEQKAAIPMDPLDGKYRLKLYSVLETFTPKDGINPGIFLLLHGN